MERFQTLLRSQRPLQYQPLARGGQPFVLRLTLPPALRRTAFIPPSLPSTRFAFLRTVNAVANFIPGSSCCLATGSGAESCEDPVDSR